MVSADSFLRSAHNQARIQRLEWGTGVDIVGQQQRAAIARALAISPEVLLFDEPTSSLDPELVDEVLSVMRKLAEEGKTMLVVTHEMEFARKVSNKVIFLHDGLIEEEGHPDTVFTNPQSERCRNFLFNRRD